MISRQLWFAEAGRVEIRESRLEDPAKDQVQVRTLISGISAGTEMLAYRGMLPRDLPLDASISGLQDQNSSFPFQYGYACVGLVEKVGHDEFSDLLGRKVFAFQPHCSRFNVKVNELICLPENISDDAGVFVANMETAVSLLIDGEIKAEETIAIFGLGVVGQLLNALLQSASWKTLYLIEQFEFRKESALKNLSTICLPPTLDSIRASTPPEGLNLIYELTGNPETLNAAIEIAAFAGRIIVGSWYGEKQANLNLGGKFHRNRLKLVSSQVSSIDPAHRREWTKKKRLQKAIEYILQIRPERFITHRFELGEAEKAYQLLDKHSEQTLQVVINYED